MSLIAFSQKALKADFSRVNWRLLPPAASLVEDVQNDIFPFAKHRVSSLLSQDMNND